VQQIADVIQLMKTVHGIESSSQTFDFTNWREIKTAAYGVYIIYHEDEIVYVGQGNIRDRQQKHMAKLTENITPETDMPDGWLHLRTQRTLDYKKFQLIVLYISDQADVNLMEAGLIKHLQPSVNIQIHNKLKRLGLLKIDQ
jgi:excinuclease UvrABC nuclease subunit